MSAPVLRVNLCAGYRKQTVLQDVRFDISSGDRLGLLGTSGAGKSTLLLALMGLLPHRGGWARGEVLVAGKDLLSMSGREARSVRGRQFALVPQSPLSALNPALSLQTHFEAAWAAHCAPDKRRLLSRVFDLADRVGLPADLNFLRRRPDEISVGQAQRCTLALALLHKPPLLIADEPTSALDPVNSAEVLKLLREVSDIDGTALLFVSHDLLSVFQLCSGVSVLAGGQLGPRVPLGAVAASRHPQLQELLRALPVPADVLLEHLPWMRSPENSLRSSEAFLAMRETAVL